MWDDASRMRRVANLLFGISLLLVAYGAVRQVLHSSRFPLRVVELTAAPQRVSEAAIAKVVREEVLGNFFTVDPERVRLALEQLPWVRRVSVRRRFPASLVVQIEEQVALARWNATELVNTYGEVFVGRVEQKLPVFTGLPDSSAEVTEMYRVLSAMLQPIGQRIEEIHLSPRHAWQVKLESGMVLELGREEVSQRMARFVAAYPRSLELQTHAVRYVDLRYRNGFAVRLAGGAV